MSWKPKILNSKITSTVFEEEGKEQRAEFTYNLDSNWVPAYK